MADVVKPDVRSKMMRGIRGKDTQPEMILRRGLFHRGFRFRLHSASLPGRPDIVIRKYRAAILIHGCFWHAHSGCRYYKLPQGNRDFWSEKLGRNRERDTRNEAALRESGWRVAVAWECAIRASPEGVLDALCDFLVGKRTDLDVALDQVSGRLRIRQ